MRDLRWRHNTIVDSQMLRLRELLLLLLLLLQKMRFLRGRHNLESWMLVL
jgi:hypothetical protein